MDRERVRLHGVVHPGTVADYGIWGKGLAASMLLLGAAQAASPERIGSWVVACPSGAEGACALHYADPLFAKSGVGANLEIRAIGQVRVPVIAVRGLPNEPVVAAAVATQVRATLQLGNGAAAVLSCGTDGGGYVCRPVGSEAAAMARALPEAGAVTIDLSASLPGEESMPAAHRTLALSGTREALTHLPASGPLPGGLEPQPLPPGWRRLLDRAEQAMGLGNGAASVQALITRYLHR